jgi:hypothetical protein
MPIIQPAPLRERVIEQDGRINKIWSRWFNSFQPIVQTYFAGIVSGTVGDLLKIGAGHVVSDSGKVPPTGTIVGTTDTQTLTNKTLGTRHQDNLGDREADELVKGAWRFIKKPSVTYTTSQVLTSAHFGKIVKFNSPGGIICTLPSVGSSDIDTWLTIMRLGTGRLVIKPADADVIESSRPGGSLTCEEVGRVVANVTLYLASETIWAITAATGIWITA